MRVCFIPPVHVLEDLSHCIGREASCTSAALARVYARVQQISQLLGKVSLFILFIFYLTWAVLWHEAITSVWAFKRRKPGRDVSCDLLPCTQGVQPDCCPSLELPPSLQLPDPSQQSGDGESPFSPLSPPHSLIILDPHFPRWVFLPYVKTQFVGLLC